MTSQGEILLRAEKLGHMTVKDLAAFAEVQGCELEVKFIRPSRPARVARRVATTVQRVSRAIAGIRRQP